MEKVYNHQQEPQQLAAWNQQFPPTAQAQSAKDPFTICLPPPNVTGKLHLGHAAMLAIEDILVRYQKMNGKEVLWVPGTDHAAIATESVVLKKLGIKDRDQEISREKFLEQTRAFVEETGGIIRQQIKRMGTWLDWSREAYTLDKKRNKAVQTIFKALYEDGLIERGHRMVNWSTGAQSVLSDDELEWEERTEPFYYLRCGEFLIATARLETKCSDSPVLLNPQGEYVRISNGKQSLILSAYAWEHNLVLQKKLKPEFSAESSFLGRELIGQRFKAQTYAGERQFWVLADQLIDMEKGTGAMTISAAHSEDDYELATRLDLKDLFFKKIDKAGRMTAIAGLCEGLTIQEARTEAEKLLTDAELLLAVDQDYTHRIPRCYRSGCVVEPMISPQWFLLVDKEFDWKPEGLFSAENQTTRTTLKALMQRAVREHHIKIIPERFEKTYFHWIDNLRDWCISRQIWWGHRIPVWYNAAGEVAQVGDAPSAEQISAENLRQDPDTLDTWFSSALWPFSTLDWPNTDSPDFKKFYPTDVLETGHDILFFWVARMIMMGVYATGKYPFHTVYLHGLVTDEKGQKMSKSKGNGIDPLDLIEEVGADAVRLSLVIGTTPGNKIPIGKNKVRGYRHFVNKLWNAGRFVKIQQAEKKEFSAENSLADAWLEARLRQTIEQVRTALENYQISVAGDLLYHFVWDEFCDWYLEASKHQSNPERLGEYYAEILRLLHPLCPLVTENLWKAVFSAENSLLLESFPVAERWTASESALSQMQAVQELVVAVRTQRAEQKWGKAKIHAGIEAPQWSEEAKSLAGALAQVEWEAETSSPTSTVGNGWRIFWQMDPATLEKQKQALQQKITHLQQRLNNPSYLKKAPKELVEASQAELQLLTEQLEALG